jgi:hypothetical protein
MTLVACWLNCEPNVSPSIWTAADTQISSGIDTLTLEGSKILELQIVCSEINTPNRKHYFRASLGFAYAGSSFTAFNTYSTLSVILSNLAGSAQSLDLPDHISITNKCRDVLKHYMTQESRAAELCIYGFCPVTHQPFISQIKKSATSNALDIEIQYGIKADLSCVILGDVKGKEKFHELLDIRLKEFETDKSLQYWRSPFYPLRDIIRSGAIPGVGGNIQLTVCSKGQFEYLSILDPVNVDANNWTLKFRNFDVLEDLGISVGKCFISLNGMFMDFKG